MLCISASLHAQRKKTFERMLQFSLTPGVGTNGLHAGSYTNIFSFNITSGYSAANKFLEIGLLSNANEIETRGLQIGGIANVTGINAYKGLSEKEIDQKYKKGFEANMIGAQLSGVVNSVLSNAYGWQATGGVNVVRNALIGFQLAGISNVVYKYSFGFQLAGISNISVQSMDGVQVAAVTNYTHGGLYGVQISAINEAGFIEGKNGYENNDYTGLQLGLVNKSRERMNGYQVGLINISGRMQGTQIGLINIYKRGKDIGTRDGTSIGLLNIGDVGHAAISANEIFPISYEISTGNRKNGRIASETKNKYVLNSLIYSTHGGWLENRNAEWALGYALRKYYYNRSVTPGMTEFWFFSYGGSFLHLNEQKKKLNNELNLLVRPEISVGKRIHPKLFGVYVFVAVSYNVLMNEGSKSELANANQSSHWPGASLGVMLH
jgi:hypothetical protein